MSFIVSFWSHVISSLYIASPASISPVDVVAPMELNTISGAEPPTMAAETGIVAKPE